MPKYKLVAQDLGFTEYIALSEDTMRTPNRNTFLDVFNLLRHHDKAQACDDHYIALPKEYLY